MPMPGAYAVVLGMVYWDTEPNEALLEEALAATQRALAIDDQNAVYYALTARTNLALRDYSAALSGNQITIELNPTFAVAYCSFRDSLAYEGRYDEAKRAVARLHNRFIVKRIVYNTTPFTGQ